MPSTVNRRYLKQEVTVNYQYILILIAFLTVASPAYAFEPLFEARIDYSTGHYPKSVFAADFDDDGDYDLAFLTEEYDSVSILLNSGNGTYGATVNYYAGNHLPSSVFAADLDGDGDNDLAVARAFSDSVSILLNAGNGTFDGPIDYGAGNGPYSVRGSDLDGDGDCDLAVTNFNDTVSILKNNGDGSYAAAISYGIGADSSASSICVADLDGDNDYDLAVANQGASPGYNGSVSVLINGGDGSFGATTTYSTGDYTKSVFAADLDGDGDQDLVVTNGFSDNVSVLKNNSNASFASAVAFSCGPNPWAVSAADLDSDGDLDLAVACSEGISILMNNGDASFTAPFEYTGGRFLSSILSADLDGDGDYDLATTDPGFDKISTYKNNGNGAFASLSNYTTNTNPCSILASDFDGDGDNDIAVAGGSDSGSIFINDGAGTFAVALKYHAGDTANTAFDSSYSISYSDLDSDGDADLVVTHCWAHVVFVLKNNGDATFIHTGNYEVGTHPSCVYIADLNADGNPDLAVANYWSSDVSILINRGDGTFYSAVNYETEQFRPNSIIAADFDGDGDNDIIVGGIKLGIDYSLAFLANDGDGTFAAAINYGQNSLWSIAAADFDQDGDKDLAVTHDYLGTVSIFHNDGNGSFSPPVDYTVGSDPRFVTASDVDGEGDFDLIIGCNVSNHVSVMLNSGNGTFSSPVNYGIVNESMSICAADLDGDGDNDLAVANGDMSILFNRSEVISDADYEIDDEQIPNQYILSQNYPNPFNPLTRIDYTIQKRDHVTIVIYNLLGQEVATIVDDVKPAGKHSVIRDGRDYQGERVASGVFFYRLRAGDITESKKMVLLK